jgi:hypothetical protein
MAFGKPSLTPLKTGGVRELQNLVVQLTARLTAIEAVLSIGNGQTLQQILQNVMIQADGTVIKQNGNLTTKP